MAFMRCASRMCVALAPRAAPTTGGSALRAITAARSCAPAHSSSFDPALEPPTRCQIAEPSPALLASRRHVTQTAAYSSSSSLGITLLGSSISPLLQGSNMHQVLDFTAAPTSLRPILLGSKCPQRRVQTTVEIHTPVATGQESLAVQPSALVASSVGKPNNLGPAVASLAKKVDKLDSKVEQLVVQFHELNKDVAVLTSLVKDTADHVTKLSEDVDELNKVIYVLKESTNVQFARLGCARFVQFDKVHKVVDVQFTAVLFKIEILAAMFIIADLLLLVGLIITSESWK